jgi:hypothetical protein
MNAPNHDSLAFVGLRNWCPVCTTKAEPFSCSRIVCAIAS